MTHGTDSSGSEILVPNIHVLLQNSHISFQSLLYITHRHKYNVWHRPEAGGKQSLGV